MQNEDDKKYIESLKRGDFVAFNALFRKYSKSLYAFALGITKEMYIAEEITQMVFMKVWEKRAKIDEHFSFKSFLFSVTYNETISWLRKEKSEKLKIDHIGSQKSYISDETNYTIEFNSINELANEIIESMPEKRQQIFKLSREQGLSNKEIANQLTISVKTVENQMTAALKTLKAKLSKSEISGLLFCFINFQ